MLNALSCSLHRDLFLRCGLQLFFKNDRDVIRPLKYYCHGNIVHLF